MPRWSFTEHPRSVGETYFEHFRMAVSFGVRMLAGGLACLVHAVLPFLFTRTGSSTIAVLHERMITNRSRLPGTGCERPRNAGAEPSPRTT